MQTHLRFQVGDFGGFCRKLGGAPEVGNVIGGLGVFSKGGGAPEVGTDWRFGCFF